MCIASPQATSPNHSSHFYFSCLCRDLSINIVAKLLAIQDTLLEYLTHIASPCFVYLFLLLLVIRCVYDSETRVWLTLSTLYL